MKYYLTILLMLCSGIAHAQSDAIVIVLDTSGSMGDHMRTSGKSRMETAQDALIAVLKDTPATTKVGILTFNGWIYELGNVNQAQLVSAIRSTRPGGGTPLYEHLRAGATRLLEERQKQNNAGYYKLLVVTDGQAGDDSLNYDSTFRDGSFKPGVLTDIISRNLIVDVIALDMREDHDLMRLNNGLDMRGDDAQTLTASLKKAVAEVGYGNQKDTDESSFSDLEGLPEDFSFAVIQGLTTFRNHPIGEKPPLLVVQQDGTVKFEPDPNNEPVSELGSGVSFFGFIMLVFVGGIAFFILIGIICNLKR